jgi:hypothetical protein
VPGEFQANNKRNFCVGHDDNSHGEIDIDRMPKQHPDSFEWSYWDEMGDEEVYVKGMKKVRKGSAGSFAELHGNMRPSTAFGERHCTRCLEVFDPLNNSIFSCLYHPGNTVNLLLCGI